MSNIAYLGTLKSTRTDLAIKLPESCSCVNHHGLNLYVSLAKDLLMPKPDNNKLILHKHHSRCKADMKDSMPITL